MGWGFDYEHVPEGWGITQLNFMCMPDKNEHVLLQMYQHMQGAVACIIRSPFDRVL